MLPTCESIVQNVTSMAYNMACCSVQKVSWDLNELFSNSVFSSYPQENNFDSFKMDEILESSWVLRTKMANPRKNPSSQMDEASMDAILEDSVKLRQDFHNDPKISLVHRISNFVKSIFHKIIGYFKPRKSHFIFENAKRQALASLSISSSSTPEELKARRKEIGKFMKKDSEYYAKLSKQERKLVNALYRRKNVSPKMEKLFKRWAKSF